MNQNCLSISICGVSFNCNLYESSCVKTQKKVIPGNNKDQKTHELVLNFLSIFISHKTSHEE